MSIANKKPNCIVLVYASTNPFSSSSVVIVEDGIGSLGPNQQRKPRRGSARDSRELVFATQSLVFTDRDDQHSASTAAHLQRRSPPSTETKTQLFKRRLEKDIRKMKPV